MQRVAGVDGRPWKTWDEVVRGDRKAKVIDSSGQGGIEESHRMNNLPCASMDNRLKMYMIMMIIILI